MNDIIYTYKGAGPKEFMFIHKSITFGDLLHAYQPTGCLSKQKTEDGDIIYVAPDKDRYVMVLAVMIQYLCELGIFTRYGVDVLNDSQLIDMFGPNNARELLGFSVDNHNIVGDSGQKYSDFLMKDKQN